MTKKGTAQAVKLSRTRGVPADQREKLNDVFSGFKKAPGGPKPFDTPPPVPDPKTQYDPDAVAPEIAEPLTDLTYIPAPGDGPSEHHTPTAETRRIVASHARVGTRRDLTAMILGITPRMLALQYHVELEVSAAQANAMIGETLFEKAVNGDTQAMMFWLKSRAGWREQKSVDVTSSDGSMTPAPTVIMLAEPARTATTYIDHQAEEPPVFDPAALEPPEHLPLDTPPLAHPHEHIQSVFPKEPTDADE